MEAVRGNIGVSQLDAEAWGCPLNTQECSGLPAAQKLFHQPSMQAYKQSVLVNKI